MRKIVNSYHIPLLFLLMLSISCQKEESNDDEPYGTISLSFIHNVLGSPLEIDIMKYMNEAGNQYLVNEIQYFISDVTLHRADGGTFMIDDFKDIHYVDTDIEDSQTWRVFDHIPTGQYTSITFKFGISEDKNHTLMFVNPPESLMFWPEYLGGGYHYMKLNGKWLDLNQRISPFDFHLGIGQVYDTAGQIVGFIHNAFEVSLPGSSFMVSEGKETRMEIIMNIENWFRSPNTYDHDIWGGDIMQNQQAMHLACENGHDVFSFNLIK